MILDNDNQQSQRYYHFVAIKSEKLKADTFSKDWGIKKTNYSAFCSEKDYKIFRLKYVTDTRLYFGEDDYSLNRDGNSPFLYDIFIIELHKQNVVILLFPFKSLAKYLLEISISKIISQGDFYKPQLEQLIQVSNTSDTEYIENGFTFHFSSIDLRLPGERNISSINLDGDKPLESLLYKTVFQKMIEKEQCLLFQSSLKCSLNYLDKEVDRNRKVNSSIHLNLDGHFKLYVHTDWKNLITIPHLFQFLHKNKLLKTTSKIPL